MCVDVLVALKGYQPTQSIKCVPHRMDMCTQGRARCGNPSGHTTVYREAKEGWVSTSPAITGRAEDIT
jgi:hypothetical protein